MNLSLRSCASATLTPMTITRRAKMNISYVGENHKKLSTADTERTHVEWLDVWLVGLVQHAEVAMEVRVRVAIEQSPALGADQHRVDADWQPCDDDDSEHDVELAQRRVGTVVARNIRIRGHVARRADCRAGFTQQNERDCMRKKGKGVTSRRT